MDDKIEITNVDKISEYYKIENFLSSETKTILVEDLTESFVNLIKQISNSNVSKINIYNVLTLQINKTINCIKFKIDGSLTFDSKKYDKYHFLNVYFNSKNVSKN